MDNPVLFRACIREKMLKKCTKYTMNARSCDFIQNGNSGFITYAKMPKNLLTFFSLRSIL